MTGGYAGKILVIDLTTGSTGTVDTSNYAEYGGGLGVGTALFWDLAVAGGDWDLQDALDPRNVITFAAGPMAGTGVPFAARCSVCGL